MKKEQLEVILQGISQKLDVVLESLAGLRSGFQEHARRMDERFDRLDSKLDALGEKLDAVAGGFSAHRADTEAHRGVYCVKET